MPMPVQCEHGQPSLRRCPICRRATEKLAEVKYDQTHRGQRAESASRRRESGGNGSYAYKLMYKYGITVADYEAILAKQSGHCALCLCEKGLEVDHDHRTGKVRGLLCDSHNRGLGHFKDDPAQLIQAAEYLLQSL